MTTARKFTRFQNHIPSSNASTNHGPGRPPLPESKDEEIKARVEPARVREIMAFCAGRRITRSDYIRTLTDLDADYFDHIELLNDPDIKQLIFHVLMVAGRI